MSANIPNWYVQQYSKNIQIMLQQKGSRFRGKAMEGSHTGAQASPVDQLFGIEMNQVTTRFSPIGRIDAKEDRRWVAPTDWDGAQLIDSFDKLRILTDPTSKYVENATYGMGRVIDKLMVPAFFGNAQNGVNGLTSIAFPTALSTAGGQTVSVSQGASGATGLTVAKLREAKKLFMANEVDLDNDPIFFAVTAKQHDNLLQETQLINLDYADRPVLTEGRITRVLGMDLVHTELLQGGTDDLSGSSSLIPVWAKSGMYIGVWEDQQHDISQRKDLTGLPYQVYSKAAFGASRLDEKRVVKIFCR